MRRMFWQLFPSFLTVTVLALVLVLALGSSIMREFYLEQVAGDLNARASLLLREIQRPLATGEWNTIDAICKAQGEISGTRFTVILPDGKVVGDSHEEPARMENHLDRPEIQKALAGQEGHKIGYSPTLKQDFIYLAVPVTREGKTQAAVRSSLSLSLINKAVDALQKRVVAWMALVVFVIVIASAWIARNISHPLEEMRRSAERFAEGDLKVRLPVPNSMEMAALAQTLNKAAAQLDERIDAITAQHNEQEAMLASMVEGVLAVDTDGRIINTNQAFARFLETETPSVRGRMVHEVLRKADFLKFVDATLASDTILDDHLVIHEEGGDRYFRACGTALHGGEGKRIGSLVVLHDVTAIHRLENVRRDFVANVSHELRTPITSIKGFVETLLDGAMEDRENANRFLHIILRQSERLNAIITDLLSLSRIERESEHHQIQLDDGPLQPVVEAAIEMCATKAREKDISIHLQCPETVKAWINSHLLEQAVTNLIDNAIKYSPEGGEIKMDVRSEHGGHLIEVQDSGCGIESKHLDRLFERFYRVDKARSRELGGTGLGLAIVKHIAKAHHGSVSVSSQVEEGSTFRILLPANRT